MNSGRGQYMVHHVIECCVAIVVTLIPTAGAHREEHLGGVQWQHGRCCRPYCSQAMKLGDACNQAPDSFKRSQEGKHGPSHLRHSPIDSRLSLTL